MVDDSLVSQHAHQPRWRRPVMALGVFALFAGMLFWTKLRLVSDIPRTAYAVPKEPADATDQPDAETAPETKAEAAETASPAAEDTTPDPGTSDPETSGPKDGREHD